MASAPSTTTASSSGSNSSSSSDAQVAALQDMLSKHGDGFKIYWEKTQQDSRVQVAILGLLQLACNCVACSCGGVADPAPCDHHQILKTARDLLVGRVFQDGSIDQPMPTMLLPELVDARIDKLAGPLLLPLMDIRAFVGRLASSRAVVCAARLTSLAWWLWSWFCDSQDAPACAIHDKQYISVAIASMRYSSSSTHTRTGIDVVAATESHRSLVCIPKHSPDDTTIARLAASRSDMVTTFLHDVLVIYAHSLTGAAAKAPAETATASGAGGGAGAGFGAGAAEAVDGTKGVTPPPAPPVAAAAAVGTHACFGLSSCGGISTLAHPRCLCFRWPASEAHQERLGAIPDSAGKQHRCACVVAYIPCDIPLRSAVHPQFVTWLQAAAAAGLVPRYGQPMTLATASPSGVPSARVCPTPHHTTPTNSGTNTARLVAMFADCAAEAP